MTRAAKPRPGNQPLLNLPRAIYAPSMQLEVTIPTELAKSLWNTARERGCLMSVAVRQELAWRYAREPERERMGIYGYGANAPFPDTKAATIALVIQHTPAERTIWQRAAARHGKSVAVLVRDAIERVCAERPHSVLERKG